MPVSERQFHPSDLREALGASARRRPRRAARGLRLRVGDAWFPIRAMDETGFDLDAAFAPKLRGLVEVHDAGGLVRTGLIVAAEPSGDLMHYDFKRATEARSTPPRDYVTAEPWDVGAAL